MEKLILTDVDGAVLDWLTPFEEFAIEKGCKIIVDNKDSYLLAQRLDVNLTKLTQLLNEFNTSDRVANLEPLPGAVEYITKLYNEGFSFSAITSIGQHPATGRLRHANMQKHFGDVFNKRIHHLPMGASKKEMLSKWEHTGTLWVEDHYDHALAGHKLGLNSVLITHPYNAHHNVPFARVDLNTAWQEIYRMATHEDSKSLLQTM